MADPKKDAITMAEFVTAINAGFRELFEKAVWNSMQKDKKDVVRVVGLCNECSHTIMINQETRLCEKCTPMELPDNIFNWVYSPPKGKK